MKKKKEESQKKTEDTLAINATVQAEKKETKRKNEEEEVPLPLPRPPPLPLPLPREYETLLSMIITMGMNNIVYINLGVQSTDIYIDRYGEPSIWTVITVL